MDERNEDILLDLLQGLVLDEVRTDAPVLLGWIEELIVDPSAVRCLQQRVIEKEAEAAARLQHPRDFGDRTVDVADVFEHQTRNNGVETGVRERKLRGSGTSKGCTATVVRHAHTVPRWIDADDVGAQLRRQPADLSIATTDIEHTRGAGQLLSRERKDLFLILGVRAIGEPIDPPACVRLPTCTHSGSVRSNIECGMDFAMWSMYDHPWDEALERAKWAEAHNYHAFWYADHLMPFTEDGATDPGDAQECWTVLAAIGAVVPRLRLVSMVSPVSIHHPVLLAKRAVTADHISGGRAVLGIGAGWQINEHDGYGFELLEPGPRVKRFAEAIEVIHRLVRGERVTFEGTYYSLKDAPLGPGPVNGTLPLLVGTGSPLMLRLTARFADEWNTWGDLDEVGVRTKRFLTACEKEGRDPATLRRSAQAYVFYVRNAEERAKAEKAAVADRTIIGSAAEVVDQLGRYEELGVDEFAIGDFNFGETREERTEGFNRFHADVLTQLL